MNRHKKSKSTLEWVGLIVLVVLAALFLSACNEDEISSLPEAVYHPPSLSAGVQTNLPVSTVLADGWEQCYQDTYDNSSTLLSDIIGGCSGGQYMMLACRPTGSATLTSAAYALNGDVLTDTGAAANGIFHIANGVAWYFNNDWSWGFIDPADTGVYNKSQCGSPTGTYPERQMCWHTVNAPFILWGHHCGTTFTSGSDHQRLIYSHL